MPEAKMVRITLVKSPIGRHKKQKATVQALGLRKMNASRVLALTPAVLGMINRVSHLIAVEEVAE